MYIHESRPIAVTIEADALSPLFVPLAEVGAGTMLLPNQCQLTFTGVASPFEVALMLCAPGTLIGDPGAAVLLEGDPFHVTSGTRAVLQGNLPALPMAGVVGLFVPVQGMMTGATIAGALSLVR